MDASFHIRPFAFERVFTPADDHPSHSSPQDLIQEVLELRAALATRDGETEAAVAAARASGFEAGLHCARAEQAVAVLAATDALQCEIEQLSAQIDDIARQNEADAAMLARAIGDYLAATQVNFAPVAAIDDAIGRALHQVARGTQIMVRVHPALVEHIERIVQVRQESDRRNLNIQVSAGAEIAPGDVVMDWDRGALALDRAARDAAVTRELALLLPGAPAA